MPEAPMRQDAQETHTSLGHVREYILAADRHARVARELWNNGRFTYQDLRSYLSSQQHSASRAPSKAGSGSHTPHSRTSSHVGHHHHDRSGGGDASGLQVAMSGLSSAASMSLSFQPTAYTFSGMRLHDNAKASITFIKFANVRSDLLAYTDSDGGLWMIRDVTSSTSTPIKAPTIHRRPITSLDWSPDNTYLLTAGLDGLTVWSVADLSPVRTVATPNPANAFTSAIFHSLSSNLVVAGSAAGNVEVMNTSTGALTLRVPAGKKAHKGVTVTALECSAHHVFVGDSTGWVHLHKQEISRPGQLAGLTHLSKLRVPGSEASTAIIHMQHVAFCSATASAVLLVTARDSSLSIIKIVGETGLELHMRCGVAPMAREIRAVVCPLSVMHCDMPRVVMGSEDTGVHIYNLSATKPPASAHQASRPLLVNTLRGHRAPVAAVSWAFDEAYLASADCDGMVIVWERATC